MLFAIHRRDLGEVSGFQLQTDLTPDVGCHFRSEAAGWRFLLLTFSVSVTLPLKQINLLKKKSKYMHNGNTY